MRRSILGMTRNAQQKMPGAASVRPFVAKLGPPEHPAQHFQLLAARLADAVVLAGKPFAVVAVQAQGAVVALAQAVDAQLAVVQDGIQLAVHDAGQAAVDGQRRAVGNQRGHVVVGHAQGDGLGRIDAEAVEGVAWQAQAATVECFELATAQGAEGDLDIVLATGEQGAVVWRFASARGAVAAIDPWQRRAVLGAFARAQPLAAHAQQFGDFVEAGLGHAAMEPVVHVLRRHLALRREVRGAQVALAQQSLQSITGCIHGHRF